MPLPSLGILVVNSLLLHAGLKGRGGQGRHGAECGAAKEIAAGCGSSKINACGKPYGQRQTDRRKQARTQSQTTSRLSWADFLLENIASCRKLTGYANLLLGCGCLVNVGSHRLK